MGRGRYRKARPKGVLQVQYHLSHVWWCWALGYVLSISANPGERDLLFGTSRYPHARYLPRNTIAFLSALFLFQSHSKPGVSFLEIACLSRSFTLTSPFPLLFFLLSLTTQLNPHRAQYSSTITTQGQRVSRYMRFEEVKENPEKVFFSTVYKDSFISAGSNLME